VWVLGHCGIHRNEEADALAKVGSSSAFVGALSSVVTFECHAEGAGVVI
jgi:ribonuclease HI